MGLLRLAPGLAAAVALTSYACIGSDPETYEDAGSDAAPGGDATGTIDAPASDGGSDATSDGPCDPNDSFGAPTVVNELVGAGWELGARLTPGGETIFFGRSASPGAQRDLYQAARPGPGPLFGNATPIVAANSPFEDGKPTFPAGVSKLYFHTNRDSNGGSVYRIYRATFDTANGFQTPTPLPDPVNPSGTSNQDPFLSTDDTELFLVSDRLGATKPEIWRIPKQPNETFGSAEKVIEASAGAFNNSPVLSADGLRLYFGRGDANPPTDTAVWMSSRVDTASAFGAASMVGGLDATNFRDEPSFISSDECTLYLYSNRSGGNFRILRAERPRK